MKSMKQLCAMYRNTHRTGHAPIENMDCLFDADKAINNQFYLAGRKLFTIESILQHQPICKTKTIASTLVNFHLLNF